MKADTYRRGSARRGWRTSDRQLTSAVSLELILFNIFIDDSISDTSLTLTSIDGSRLGSVINLEGSALGPLALPARTGGLSAGSVRPTPKPAVMLSKLSSAERRIC